MQTRHRYYLPTFMGHSGQFLGNLPESLRLCFILGSRRRFHTGRIREIRTVHFFGQSRRNGRIQRAIRTLSGRLLQKYHDWVSECVADLHPHGHVARHFCTDQTRMHREATHRIDCVDVFLIAIVVFRLREVGHVTLVQTFRQFSGEQDIRQLRLRIRGEQLVVLLGHDVVEIKSFGHSV